MVLIWRFHPPSASRCCLPPLPPLVGEVIAPPNVLAPPLARWGRELGSRSGGGVADVADGEPPGGLHAGDEPLDPLVDRTERVLAQHGALRLVVELEVHPVDGEVTSGGLGGADELATQPRRVVCGGLSTACAMSSSVVTRAARPLRCSRSKTPRPRLMSW